MLPGIGRGSRCRPTDDMSSVSGACCGGPGGGVQDVKPNLIELASIYLGNTSPCVSIFNAC